MATLGSATLIAAFGCAIYAIAASIYGATKRDQRWIDSGRRAVYAMAASITLGIVILEAAFLGDDFSFALVAEHSSTTTETMYKAAAMWSSQEGSLLLWAWVLSLASSAAIFLTKNRHREIVPWATAVLMAIGAFFTGLMVFTNFFDVSPFQTLSPAPAEGAGLTPLLRHPSMMIHPPMLYSGYVMWSIPFAFCIGALITRKVDASWIRSTRRFALIAWTFLGVGLLLGSRWSYTELGWGGYWAWDPVENAALMPWLMGTAFLHSVMVQEKRDMLKVWNVTLIIGTFALSLFGTFLVRSGVLQSIHAFGASTIGGPLLVLIAVVLLGSAALVVSRLDDLRTERRIDSVFSREAIFLINNLLLVGMVAVIFWLTVFPLVSEALTGTERNIGPPIFNRIVTPIAVLLVLFTGVGPLVAWGRFNAAAAKRVLLWPAIGAVVALAALLAFSDALDHVWAMLLFSLAAFTGIALAQEFWRAGSARKALVGGSQLTAMGKTVGRNRRRYGGYIVHLGIAVLLIGIAASSSFQTNRDLRLDVGQSAKVGDYDVTYEKATTATASNGEYVEFGAVLRVTKDGKTETLTPSRRYFASTDANADPATPVANFFDGESTSEVGLDAGVRNDLWTAFQPDLGNIRGPIKEADRKFNKLGPDVQGLLINAIAQRYTSNPLPANFRVIVDPLVTWLWIGALIAIGGALIAGWPGAGARRRVSAAAAVRAARGLSKA
jgi:cytochrome c-type biogenesis protein CcmF